MSTKIVVGLDGSSVDTPAIAFAKKLANRIDACEVVLVFVVEWSPYSFQTPEENAERHKRRALEIERATERVIDPAVAALAAEGLSARGIVRHGDVAEVLDEVAKSEGAEQIVVGRSNPKSMTQRVFGSSTASLVMHSSVPVTVVA